MYEGKVGQSVEVGPPGTTTDGEAVVSRCENEERPDPRHKIIYNDSLYD